MSSPYVPDRRFWLNYWRELYAVPRAWALKGENLVHAFEAVAAASQTWPMNFDMRDQALMLAGMALEVQLKALIVNNPQKREIVPGLRKPLTKEERKLRKSFYRHNLVDICSFTDITATREQQEILLALSSFVYWKGRYIMPTELGIDDIIPIEDPDGLVGSPTRAITLADADALISLVIEKVHSELGNKAQPAV